MEDKKIPMDELLDEIASKVENGSRFYIDYYKRTLRVDGEYVDLSGVEYPFIDSIDMWGDLHDLYDVYKHSIPSERSEHRRRCYFKALREHELSDEDMLFGERRETARCRLELYLLLMILSETFVWDEDKLGCRLGNWFWQSSTDKDFIILREWIEPKKES